MAARRGSRLRSIRTRIVVGYVVLGTLALAVTFLIGRGALLSRLNKEIDDRLAAEIDQLQVVIEEGDPSTGASFDSVDTVFETHLQRLLPGDDAAFYTLVEGEPFNLSFGAPVDLLTSTELVESWSAAETSTFSAVSTDAGEARLLVVPVVLDDTRGTFVAAVFTRNSRNELNDVFRTLALVGILAMLTSALIAMTIAARVVQPIRELIAVARSVTEEDLSTRIPVDGDDELAELATTFNAMMARLEGGFSAQRAFLDDVAHELRTPITIIHGHLDVLDVDDVAERAATVEILHDELDRMNRYVDELLLLAQAERPDFLTVTTVDVDVLASTLLAKASSLAPRRWVLDNVSIGVVELDVQRITQAVLNLASNAVSHTSDGDEIGIGLVLTSDTLTLTVRDAGSGVDPAVLNKLFERHVRSAESRTSGGSGLGLSIVDAIAVAHGGRVAVHSEVGQGATFSVIVPVHRSSQSTLI